MLKVGRPGRWPISSSSEEMDGVMMEREEAVEDVLGAGASGVEESRDMGLSFLTATVTAEVSSLTVMSRLSSHHYTTAEHSAHYRVVALNTTAL